MHPHQTFEDQIRTSSGSPLDHSLDCNWQYTRKPNSLWITALKSIYYVLIHSHILHGIINYGVMLDKTFKSLKKQASRIIICLQIRESVKTYSRKLKSLQFTAFMYMKQQNIVNVYSSPNVVNTLITQKPLCSKKQSRNIKKSLVLQEICIFNTPGYIYFLKQSTLKM